MTTIEARAPRIDLELERRLAALEARITALEAREAARDGRRRLAGLRRGDAAALAKIVPAIVGAFGSEEFLSRELETTAHVGLRHVLAGRTAKTIGRLLARAAGIPIGGYVIEACGDELRVRKWRVSGFLEVRNPHGPIGSHENSR